MTNERMEVITEEILECQDLKELKALWCFGQHESNEYGDAQFVPDFRAAVARLKNNKEEVVEQEKEEVVELIFEEVDDDAEGLTGHVHVIEPGD